MRSLHVPVWLGAVSHPGIPSLAALYAVSTFYRALLITVLPLLAHRLLGDAQAVSVFYFLAAVATVGGSLALPWLVRRFRRRFVLSFGALGAPVGMAFLATDTLWGLAVGMPVYMFSTTCVEICLNLYVLEHVQRRDIGRFEPMRIFVAAGAWLVGPWLGVILTETAWWLVYAVASVGALAMLGYFWFLRMADHPAVPAMKQPPPNPLHYFPRFFRQPRLRLAWVLAFGRSCWWTSFYVYGPILAVTSGLDAATGGAIVSLGMGSLFFARFWGMVGRRWGLRRLLIGGYAATGAVTIAVGIVAGLPWACAALLVASAMGAGIIDGAGNTPFLRAVHPYERPEMTTVFITYRDASQFTPPGIFSALLKVFDLPAVFFVLGGSMFVMAGLARYLPKRL
jgi:MFS transporter, ACDE family, multidrug resistance protein